ncbi:hypothetical protein AB0L40_06690 [Patulibacter sp. NPDC049589]|uniref:hypothetical protein n=1 Tax=Patulibacter sp. NPDC049589 TaxID=3154731 RepID=UPI0034124C81
MHLQIPKGFDCCVAKVVAVEKTRRSQSMSTVATASVALNAAEEDDLHERDLAGLMAGATSLAFTGIPSHRHPTAAQVISGTAVLGKAVSAVALAGPDVQVQAGTIGVWLDGTRTSVTATTPGGRHLYFDYDRSTRGVSSNVLTALNDTAGADLLGGD